MRTTPMVLGLYSRVTLVARQMLSVLFAALPLAINLLS